MRVATLGLRVAAAYWIALTVNTPSTRRLWAWCIFIAAVFAAIDDSFAFFLSLSGSWSYMASLVWRRKWP